MINLFGYQMVNASLSRGLMGWMICTPDSSIRSNRLYWEKKEVLPLLVLAGKFFVIQELRKILAFIPSILAASQQPVACCHQIVLDSICQNDLVS